MIDKCLMGYSKSFIDFINTFKKDFYIDQETFESLLPSKEIILEDEKKYMRNINYYNSVIVFRICVL